MASATLSNGIRLAYDDYNFAPPWKTPEPVVLVHGFSKNRRFWYQWVPEVAKEFRTIRVDLRGHGESSPIEPGFTMSLQPFADDLAAFLDALGLASAHFVMVEFASAVAVEFANRHGERIRSLTVPGFGYNYAGGKIDWPAWVDMVRQGGTERWARETNHYRLTAQADPQLREWYIREQSVIPPWFMIELFTFIPTLNLTDQLPGMRVPTLIVNAKGGQQGTIEDAEYAARTIPDCRLVTLPGAGFNVMTAAPEPTIAATRQFIREIIARGKENRPGAVDYAQVQR